MKTNVAYQKNQSGEGRESGPAYTWENTPLEQETYLPADSPYAISFGESCQVILKAIETMEDN